jgi:hypothetical protein
MSNRILTAVYSLTFFFIFFPHERLLPAIVTYGQQAAAATGSDLFVTDRAVHAKAIAARRQNLGVLGACWPRLS